MPLKSSIPVPALSAQQVQAFWLKVHKTDTCWLWTGAKINTGYGLLTLNDHAYLAHRVAYTLSNGPIPRGLLVLHRCDNRQCIHPDHLFLGTFQDNSNDMYAKGRGLKGVKVSPEHIRRGEQCRQAVLTVEDVIAIRQRYATEQITQAALAAEYGVRREAIGKIIRRERWRHID